MGVVKNLMTRYGADASGFIKGTQKAENAFSKYRKNMSRSAGLLKGALGALSAIGVVTSMGQLLSTMQECREEFIAGAQAEAKLAQVMRNTMHATDAQIKSVLDLASSLQDVGVVADDVTISGAQELATYLHLTSSLKTLLPVLDDMLVQQYGINATQENAVAIATMLGKVMDGQTSALSRYGYTFDDAQAAILKTGNEMERAAVLAQVVSASVGGMNAAMAQTDVGRIQQLNNAWSDVKETLGAAFNNLSIVALPVIQAIASGLAMLANLALQASNAIRYLFTGEMPGESGGITAAVGDAAADLTDAAETTASGVGGAAKKLERAMAGFDKLNVLGSSSSGGGGGGGNGLDFKGWELPSWDEGNSALDGTIQKCEQLVEELKSIEGGWKKAGEEQGKVGIAMRENLQNAINKGSEAYTSFSNWFGGGVNRLYSENVAPFFTRWAEDILSSNRYTKSFYERWRENVMKIPVLGPVYLDFLDGLENGEKQYQEFRKQQQAKFRSEVEESGGLLSWLSEQFSVSFSNWQGGMALTRQKWSETTADMKTRANDLFTTVGQAINNWYNTKVMPYFTAAKWQQLWNDAKTGFINGLTSALRSAQEKLNSFIRAVNSKLSINVAPVEVNGKTLFSGKNFTLFQIPEIHAFANGGFPETGSLFMARENGPELVGSIGNRSAVANNMQIVDGIADGVYRAVVSAMGDSSAGGKQTIRGKVYLDRRELRDSLLILERSIG